MFFPVFFFCYKETFTFFFFAPIIIYSRKLRVLRVSLFPTLAPLRTTLVAFGNTSPSTDNTKCNSRVRQSLGNQPSARLLAAGTRWKPLVFLFYFIVTEHMTWGSFALHTRLCFTHADSAASVPMCICLFIVIPGMLAVIAR